jgi:hypothetical protein
MPLYGVSGVSFGTAAATASPDKLAAGVYGQSMNKGCGVLGVTKRTDSYGIGGVSTNPRWGVGVFGHSAKGNAGYFEGNVTVEGLMWSDRMAAGEWVGQLNIAAPVSVNGDLYVSGQIIAGTKDAVVPFPDGSKRLLHCMESPEHWFEDFGSARLTRGRATVKFDADFAKVVTLNGYRVFLTPEGDCHGLYVRKRGSSFEVRELQGGTSNVAFSYRIVAKRKDIKRHTRFAKIDTTIPILKGAARAGRGRKTARPSSRLFAALTKDARKKAAARKAAVRG